MEPTKDQGKVGLLALLFRNIEWKVIDWSLWLSSETGTAFFETGGQSLNLTIGQAHSWGKFVSSLLSRIRYHFVNLR